MTSVDGLCVAMMRWMPADLAIAPSLETEWSISLPATAIRSAISSTITTINGIFFNVISSSW